MKKVKKMIPFILVAVLLLSLAIPVSAFAEQEDSYEMTDDTELPIDSIEDGVKNSKDNTGQSPLDVPDFSNSTEFENNLNDVSKIQVIGQEDMITNIENSFEPETNLLLSESNLPTAKANVPSPVAVGDEITSGDYTYIVNEDGTASIVRYSGTDENLVIPSTLDEYTVTGIGFSSFASKNTITSVIVPDSVIDIGETAFYNCDNLTSVTFLSTNIRSMGNRIFSNCDNLTSVILPGNLQSIPHQMFYYCEKLESITIPESVTKIEYEAFAGCLNLSSLILPQNISSIGESAFSHCANLESVVIPNGVTVISNNTFLGCTDLTSISIPQSVKNIFPKAFYNCNNLTTVYYDGTPEEWNEITISSENDILKNVDVIYTKVSNISIAPRTATIKTGEDLTITATITPDTAINKNIEWTSDKPDIAAVDDGVVTGIKPGTAVITATTVDGNYSATCSITVECSHKNTTYHAAEASTCVKHGHTEYTICDDCKTILSGENVELPLAEHTWDEWQTVIPATCTEDGSEKRICSVCNEEETRTVSAVGHEYSDEWTVDIPATCTVAGSKSHHCAACGAKKDITVIPAVGHSFGDWELVSSPNCTNEGSEKRICAICQFTETRSVDPTGHTWESSYTIDKEATCTEDGSQSIHCSKCDVVKDSVVIPATGHQFGEWKTVSDTTEVRTCATCGYTESRKKQTEQQSGEGTSNGENQDGFNQTGSEKTDDLQNSGNNDNVPKTGDSAAPLWIWYLLAAGAVIMIAVLVWRQRKTA